MLRVAIVGAGRIGHIRAGVIRSSAYSVLTAVIDSDPTRSLKLAEGTQALSTASLNSVLGRDDFDVVVVATPTKFHAEIAIAAMRAGKHVLCEKPLARNVDEARHMVETARQTGCLLKVGFNYRHMAHVRKAKELLDSSALGPLYFLRCRYGHGGRPGYEKEWCTDAELSGGGVLLEQGIHIFDLVRHLLGEPSRLVAQTGTYFWKFPVVEDNGFCMLQTIDGQLAQIHVSWTQWVNVLEVEIFGRDGYLRLEGRDGHYGHQRLVWGKRRLNHGRPEEEIFEFGANDGSWEREWRDFCFAIEEGANLNGSACDGLRAQQLIEAAYQSSLQHSWITIPVLIHEQEVIR